MPTPPAAEHAAGVWALGFTPAHRSDAAPRGRKGKRCGASHISRNFNCGKGSQPSHTAAKIALGVGIAAGAGFAAYRWNRSHERGLQEAIAAGRTWDVFSRKQRFGSCRIDAYQDCPRQIGEPSAYGKVYVHPDQTRVFKVPVKVASVIASEREFKHHVLAHDAGVPVPEPIAYKPAKGVISMEYIPGSITLRQYSKAPINAADQRTMGPKMLQAYRKLHRAGIAHGDLHPGNFLVLPDRSIRFIDFGHSHSLRHSRPDSFYLTLEKDLGGVAQRVGTFSGVGPQANGIDSWMRQANKPFLQAIHKQNLTPIDYIKGIDDFYANLNKAINYARIPGNVITRSTRI
jgi:predicted Ser/Thr protein kinase